jgi:hypothetical protein
VLLMAPARPFFRSPPADGCEEEVELTRSCSSCLGPRAETVPASLIFVGDGIVTGKAGPPCRSWRY